MGKRRLARETALQGLYLTDVTTMGADEAFRTAGGGELDDTTAAFTRRLLDGAVAQLRGLDTEIKATAQNWEIGRMASVDRSLLRMAAYELLYCPETPVSVIIDEAVEIAKKYSSEDSSKFINGILGKLKDRRSPAAS
ncbi:MAG: transcription antitermination factor NusB [Elusimicrobia bacterium]|nr:transcription antitermination factor NusB [Elusimicrobiota bacterium]